jgi:hypothetical protein
MFAALFIFYLIWAIPAWFNACEELNDIKEAEHYGYDYF